jgi:VanZ family protein
MTDASPFGRWTTAARAVVLVTYSAAIIYFGTRPAPVLSVTSILSNDKLMHALAFGTVCVLAYRYLACLQPRQKTTAIVVLAVVYASVLGAALELIQSMVPCRSMEFADFVADVIGATLCGAIARRTHIERKLTRWGL